MMYMKMSRQKNIFLYEYIVYENVNSKRHVKNGCCTYKNIKEYLQI